MRTLRRNKQHLYYAMLIGTMPEYALDKDGNKILDEVASDGTVTYKRTGRKVNQYSEPQGFMANISFSTSDVVETEFGVDLSGYDAVLVMDKDEIPITETSLLWYRTEPVFKDADKTILDESSADFKVLQVKPSLNYTKYILQRLNK